MIKLLQHENNFSNEKLSEQIYWLTKFMIFLERGVLVKEKLSK